MTATPLRFIAARGIGEQGIGGQRALIFECRTAIRDQKFAIDPPSPAARQQSMQTVDVAYFRNRIRILPQQPRPFVLRATTFSTVEFFLPVGAALG